MQPFDNAETKVCSNGPGSITKMAAMPKYEKKKKKKKKKKKIENIIL